MNIIKYLLSKFFKKLPGSAIVNSVFEKPSKCEAQSTVIDSVFGKYSYCGYYCTILNTQIGRFVSIADGVSIGLTDHPTVWVSTSPAFYYGRDSIPKDLARREFIPNKKTTYIGNDVWIGKNAIILAGVNIGDGSIIGAGAVVTKDVAPYSIVGGVPAMLIKKRFDDSTIDSLLKMKWWNWSREKLLSKSDKMDDIEAFLLSVDSDIKE